MAVTSVQENLTYLTYVAGAESAAISKEEAAAARAKKVEQQETALGLQEEAGNIRGDAADTQATCNAVATGLGAAAAVCACFPPIGTIIAAVLAIAAAVLAIVAACMTNGKQQEAAAIDKEAGVNNVEAEKLDAKADEEVENRREERQQMQQNIQQLLEFQEKDAKNNELTFASGGATGAGA
jgi:hypothetical protein